MSIPTPHNAAQKGDIARRVLMPGDPLRAKYIAETYLEAPVCFNTVRNMLGLYRNLSWTGDFCYGSRNGNAFHGYLQL
mgnify:FL=1